MTARNTAIPADVAAEIPSEIQGADPAAAITEHESKPFDLADPADAAFWAEILTAMPKIRGAAGKLGRSHGEREDLVQDALERCIRHRRSFKLGTNMAAWACFVLRNGFYSDMRRAWRSVEMAEGQAERVPGPSNQHLRVELGEVLDALQYLPADQVDALLTVSEGLSYEEAAEELAARVGTVKSRVSRARDALELFFSA